ncbi:MAG: DUF302 domain-containing protein [Pseudomonadota bacterium]
MSRRNAHSPIARLAAIALAPALALGLFAGSAGAGMVTVESPHSVAETIDRLAAAVEKAGATVFARVDHGAGAARVGQPIGASQLLIFGNPKLGTPVISAAPTAGLDLPLKVLAYEGPDGTVMVYHDPADLSASHGVPEDHPAIGKMTGALGKLTGAAAAE